MRRQKTNKYFPAALVFALMFSAAVCVAQEQQKQPAPAETLTLSIVGDMNFCGKLGKIVAEKSPYYFFSQLPDDLRKADITAGGLECPLTYRKTPAAPGSCACNPMISEALQREGFDVFFIANEHIFDRGPDGMYDTLNVLKKRDMKGLGAAEDLLSAQMAYVMMKGEIKVAFLAFSAIPDNRKKALSDRTTISTADEGMVRMKVKVAKAVADVVVVSFRWGEDGGFVPTDEQKRLAYVAADAGAALIVGGHTHTLQRYEIRNKSFIVYGLGNFLTDNLRTSARESAILTAVLSKKGVESVEFLPFVIENYRPVPVNGDDAVKILKTLAGERPRSIWE